MAYKIYIRGNYFYIVDTVTGRERDGLAKNVRVTRGTTSEDDFSFYGVNDWSVDTFLNIADIQDENGNAYTVNSFIDFYERLTGQNAKNYTGLASNDLGLDAWGRPKMVSDRSIVHGMFSFNVPVTTWKETFNGTERAITNASSVDGKLVLTSGATFNDGTILSTYRNPRYQPNRGYLYSTAGIIPNVSDSGIRRWGVFTEDNGVYFSLEVGTLYAVVKTTVGGVTTEDKKAITLGDIDLSKGNVFDIQFQWRGVGNYKFFINLKEVVSFDYLGTLTDLSMSNPALPIAFQCYNLGQEVEMHFGCVDVTSEGEIHLHHFCYIIGISKQTCIPAYTSQHSCTFIMNSSL